MLFIGFSLWRKMVDSILNLFCARLATINRDFHCWLLWGFYRRIIKQSIFFIQCGTSSWWIDFSPTAPQSLKGWQSFFSLLKKKKKQLCILHSTVIRLMCNSCQSHSLLIQNVTCSRIRFRYTKYSAIYWYTLELFFSYSILLPLSPSIFISNPTSFWPVIRFIQHVENGTLILITLHIYDTKFD